MKKEKKVKIKKEKNTKGKTLKEKKDKTKTIREKDKTLSKAKIQEEKNKKVLEKIEEYNNNGKRTIAIFCDAYYPVVDGVIKVFENQAMLLSKNNNVIVCVPKHKNKLHEDDRPYLVLGSGSIQVSSVGYDYALPAFDAFFNKAINKARIDIVHLHSPFTMGSFATTLAKKRKIPCIGTFHSEYKTDFYKATKNKSLTQLLVNGVASIFNKCDIVCTMNPYAASVLKDYGYKGEFEIIPNSTGFKVREDIEEEKEKIRNEFGITEEHHVFSYLGRLVLPKQILFIADVMKRLKENGIKLKMIYIGKGVDAGKLKKRIAENGLTDDVILTGSVTDEVYKSALLGISELFIFPSMYDTDGIVKIEAACAKVPTICIKGTGASSVLTDNVNGYITEFDLDIFTNRILEIIKDKERMRQVGEQAFKDLYVTWEEIVERIEKVYDEQIEKMLIKKLNKARAKVQKARALKEKNLKKEKKAE